MGLFGKMIRSANKVGVRLRMKARQKRTEVIYALWFFNREVVGGVHSFVVAKNLDSAQVFWSCGSGAGALE